MTMKRETVVAQFERLLPLAVQWAVEMETHILTEGVPLSAEESAEAQAVGAVNAGRVHLLRVDMITRPQSPALREACEALDFLTPETRGLTLGYGILIRSDCWRERGLVVHELVHTAQYERLGGIEPFLRQYLLECLTVGYTQSPLEQEAVSRSAERMTL
jgi:hypothetical protein